MEKISCVLITREKKYPEIVWERLNLGFFDEYIIETESPHIYRRYELAKTAANQIVFVCDDDVLVNYQVLFSKYDGRITNAMTLPFQKQYEPLGCTLVGFGCYFPKSMLSVFDKYIAKYGENDPHLLREADRIFTALNRPFNTIIQPHEDLFQNTGRMSTNPDGTIIQSHFDSRDEALRKCREL